MARWCFGRTVARSDKQFGEKLDPKYAVEIDVQKLIEDLVWKKFMKSLCVFKRCFYRRNDYEIVIRWSYFSFKDYTVSVDTLREVVSDPHVQHETTYSCNITEAQKHVFNAEVSEIDSKTVKLQRNYNIGGKLSINVAGIDFNLSKNIQNGDESKKEMTCKWMETTEFTLNRNESAKLVIEEENDSKEKFFVVKTVLQLRPTHPGWGAPVFVRKKSNYQKVYQYEILGFRELFESYAECNDLVEIRPGAHLQEFGDGNHQYYDEVYIFSRGLLQTKLDKRTVSVASVNAQAPPPGL